MNKLFLPALTASLIAATPIVHASLVFNEVIIGRYIGSLDDPSAEVTLMPVTVRPGLEDEFEIHSYQHVNVDPTSIHVRFDPPFQAGVGDIGTFNGLKITGLDWHGEQFNMRFDIRTNMVEELCNVCMPYSNRLIFGDNFIAFDWRRYLYDEDSYFDVRIRPQPHGQVVFGVPEPSSLPLLAMGLAALMLTTRRELGYRR